MRKPSHSGLLISLLVASGCSASGSGPTGTPGGSSSGGNSGSSTGSGTGNGSEDSGSAGTMGGSSSSSSGSSGLDTDSGSDSGSSGTVPDATASTEAGGGAEGGKTSGAGPFTCTLVLGLFTTSEWFEGNGGGNAGWGATKTFLMDGVDPTKWESKTAKNSYVEKWADPASAQWALPLTPKPCATNSTTPDRVVFVGFSPNSAQGKSQAGWQMLLNGVIATIKMKYPSAKEIDIWTMARAPNNMLCPNNNDVYTTIPPYEDAAYDAVAAASGGFVVVGPKYFVPDCQKSWSYPNDTDFTTSASNYIAMTVAAYYVAHP